MVHILEVIDKTGRSIYLPIKQWSHIIRRHPNISNYIEEIKETLKNPLKITSYSLDKDVKYYYSYLKNKNPPKYLLVIVTENLIN
ncbi:MAG: hypothetical protein Q7S74_04740 [Nanoarchaeota archaeon]|nr:hypothetical protein [Nanoarchaeota archaeon]